MAKNEQPQMPWIDRTHLCDKGIPGSPNRGWVDSSNRWVVMAYNTPSADGTEWEGVIRVAIKCHDDRRNGKEIIVPWTAIQNVKEKLFPGRLAIEIYPPRDRLVDVAPLRWLWVLPKGFVIPFTLESCQTELIAT